MATDGAEGRTGRVAPVVATLGNTGPIARPRSFAIPWRATLVADVAAATALMFAWQGIVWLFALLASYAGRPGTAPVSATEFFTRVSLQEGGLRHLAIARQGYDATSAAHPPFFAMLTRLLATVVPSWPWAGAIVSHVALIAALVYLVALARLDFDEQDSTRSLGVALLWPAAPLLGMITSSSLIMLTVTAALYHARRRQWGWAGVLAAHASLTGGIGVLVLVPLLVEWLEDRPWRLHPGVALGGLAAVLSAPIAFLAFLGLLQVHIGSPLAYFQAQAEVAPGALLRPLGLETMLDWRAIAADAAPLVRGYPVEDVPFSTALIPAMINSGLIALAALCGIWLLREGRRSYGCFVLAGVVATALIGGLPGSAANLLPFVPIYFVLARWLRRPVVGYLALFLGLDLLALYLYLFVNGYWPI
jgi:hypothetical protein